MMSCFEFLIAPDYSAIAHVDSTGYSSACERVEYERGVSIKTVNTLDTVKEGMEK